MPDCGLRAAIVHKVGGLVLIGVIAVSIACGCANAQPQASVMQEQDRAVGPDFILRACNRTPKPIWISIGARGTTARHWYVAGWWQIRPQACHELGRFRRPTIYLHAENADGRQWGGIDAKLCVELNNFEHTYDPMQRCDGVIRGFYKKSIDPSWSLFEWRVGQ